MSKVRTILRQRIGQLRKREADAFASRQRYREQDYLLGVYELYREWIDDPDRAASDLAEMSDVKLRRGTDLLRVIIDCSTQETNRAMKSRWANALRYADSKSVKPDALLGFIAKRSGIAGCAAKFAVLKKKMPARSRRQEKQDDDWD